MKMRIVTVSSIYNYRFNSISVIKKYINGEFFASYSLPNSILLVSCKENSDEYRRALYTSKKRQRVSAFS